MVDPRRSRCRVPSRVQGKGDVAGGERSSSGQPCIPDAPDAFPFKQIKNNSQQNRVLKEPPLKSKSFLRHPSNLKFGQDFQLRLNQRFPSTEWKSFGSHKMTGKQACKHDCRQTNKTACVLVCLRVSNQARGSLNRGGHDHCVDKFEGGRGQVHAGGASGRLVAGTKCEGGVGGCRRVEFLVSLVARSGGGSAGMRLCRPAASWRVCANRTGCRSKWRSNASARRSDAVIRSI